MKDMTVQTAEQEWKVPDQTESLLSGLMPLTGASFSPGRCVDYINTLKDGAEKEIARAEYHYFRGEPETALQLSAKYLASPDMMIRLSASLLYVYSCISLGQTGQAGLVLSQLRNIGQKSGEDGSFPAKAAAFISGTAAVLLHLPIPESALPIWEAVDELPQGLRALALYVFAHQMYLQGNFDKSIGIVEAALAMGGKCYPIPAVYLHLTGVMSYAANRQKEQAKRHLLAAWRIALPDGLIEGFGEHHGLMGGMLEAVIKPAWPVEFRKIIGITYRFSDGWRRIHNPETGNHVTDDLTTTEFSVAMLAARGWTNQEIGEHMKISINTVKAHVAQAMRKLNVENRKRLKEYLLP